MIRPCGPQRLDPRAVRRATAVTAESARWSSLAERASWRSAATARRWTSNRASGSAMAISSHLRSLTDRKTHMFSVPSSQLAGQPQTACRRTSHPPLLPARWRSNRTGGKVNGGRATWTVAGTRIFSAAGQAADPILAPRPLPVASFQVGELPAAGVGGEGGEPVAVDVGEAQLGAGVGAFLTHDDPHRRRQPDRSSRPVISATQAPGRAGWPARSGTHGCRRRNRCGSAPAAGVSSRRSRLAPAVTVICPGRSRP